MGNRHGGTCVVLLEYHRLRILLQRIHTYVQLYVNAYYYYHHRSRRRRRPENAVYFRRHHSVTHTHGPLPPPSHTRLAPRPSNAAAIHVRSDYNFENTVFYIERNVLERLGVGVIEL